MKNILTIIILLFVAVGCSSNKVELDTANKVSSISNDKELIKIQEEICNGWKSDDDYLRSCGSGYSSDLELSKNYAILSARIELANILGSTISKNEKQIVNEVSGDFVREYTSEEINEIHQQGINNYRIVYHKSFMHKGKFRSLVVIEMSHNV